MDSLQLNHASLRPAMQPATAACKQAAPQLSTKAHIRAAIQRHPLLALYAIMFVPVWIVLFGQAFESYGLLPFHIPPLLGIVAGWAPALAAVIVTAITQGREGLGVLARRVFRWRVHVGWYVLAFGLLAVLMLTGDALYATFSGQPAALPIDHLPMGQALLSFAVLFMLNLLVNTEEVAWRGVVLPHLQARRSTLAACLMLAVPEALFHAPYFFTKGSFYQAVGPLAFILFTVSEVILFAWVFNNTRGSVLIVMLLHASQNTWSALLTPQSGVGVYYATVGLLCLIAVGLVIRFGSVRLSDKHADGPFII